MALDLITAKEASEIAKIYNEPEELPESDELIFSIHKRIRNMADLGYTYCVHIIDENKYRTIDIEFVIWSLRNRNFSVNYVSFGFIGSIFSFPKLMIIKWVQ